MRVLRFEMTRAFRNKWLAVSIALGTLIGLADIWLNVSQYGFNRGRALIQTWIGTDYQFAYNSLFYVLLPLIACFPYAGSCYQDQKTGYESSICIKTSRLSYMIAKEAAGNGGFGYDPILWLPEYGKTSAELTMEEKNRISHRGKALERMKDALKEALGE
mgnify:CR=1 FL=1